MDFNSIEKLRKKYPIRLTRGRAIKLYCKELCCCGDTKSWIECSSRACFLWPFRKGKEMLGNQTSFKKHRANTPVFEKKQGSTSNQDIQLNNILITGKDKNEKTNL